jgi:hypothetical protein
MAGVVRARCVAKVAAMTETAPALTQNSQFTEFRRRLETDLYEVFGLGSRKPPEPTTCTMPPERKLWVFYQHKIAAQALLADMLGTTPTLTTVHEGAQFHGLGRDPGTFVEVLNHPHYVPNQIRDDAVMCGLYWLTLDDDARRTKFTRGLRTSLSSWAKP